MTKKKVLLFSLFLLMVLVLTVPAGAEIKTGDILSYSTNADGVTVFIANPEGKENYELDCQIGAERPEEMESHLITEDPVSVKTLILMDNSLSVRSKYRERISEILENLVEEHAQNEQYTIVCFSDQPEYLLKDSKDYESVKETIHNVTYKDQDSYLTDSLYNILANQEKNGEPVFRRIVIVSDGGDNRTVGYTKEELSALLEKNLVPVYTLGCTAKNNEEQLQDFLALSRSTNGESFLLDDLEDNEDFIQSIKQTDYTIRADIRPKKEDLDGMEKAIKITLSTDGGTAQSNFNVKMPFAEITEETPEESGSEAASEKEEGLINKEKILSFLVPVLIAAGLLMLVAGIAAIVLGRKKVKMKDDEVEDEDDYNDNPTVLIGREETHTVLIDSEDESIMPEDKIIVLRYENDRYGMEFSAPITKVLVVGRRSDCDIVIPKETVSRQQFEIGCEGNIVWIRNLSDYGTLLNGKALEGRTEICTGDRITVGNARLVVEIRG